MPMSITSKEAKLEKWLELNEKLREQLEITRLPVSEASRSLIDYCKMTPDSMVPSVWGVKNIDSFPEPTGCSCNLM
ncbi:hypothetical protein BDF14DRAFT_1994716 [Spinellus fusiger]|nr:hypothetical protein BDF14DRAFT_1994716 [Spinellus fusiger]